MEKKSIEITKVAASEIVKAHILIRKYFEFYKPKKVIESCKNYAKRKLRSEYNEEYLLEDRGTNPLRLNTVKYR